MPDTSAPQRSVAARPSTLVLGDRPYDLTHRALVVGLLTAPSGPLDLDTVLAQAEADVVAGADILELGGAAGPVGLLGEQEEIDRVVPAVEALRARFPLPVCIATTRPAVARVGFGAGADLANLLGGATPSSLAVVAERSTAVALVGHDRGRDEPIGATGPRLALLHAVRQAEQAGLAPSRLLLDPGFDDDGTPWLVRHPDDLADLGCPLVLSWPDAGTGALLGAVAVAIGRGCRVLRVHEVRAARRVADTMAAILEAP